MTIIGCITWVASAVQMFFLDLFAQRIAYKVKVHYFAAVIHKDATWFDNNNSHEISSKISRETTAIENGIGNKIGLIY